MIIFLILFVLSGFLYFFSKGFDFLNYFIKKTTEDKAIMDILKSSIKIDDDDDDKKSNKEKGNNKRDDEKPINNGDDKMQRFRVIRLKLHFAET